MLIIQFVVSIPQQVFSVALPIAGRHVSARWHITFLDMICESDKAFEAVALVQWQCTLQGRPAMTSRAMACDG